MDFLEIDKSNLIWFLTSLIGISSLIFINFSLSNRWIQIIQNAIAVLLTVILSFIFAYFEGKMEFSKTLSELASIGTPLIALFAYWEYKSKTANKVNEKQLDLVLELLNKIKNRKFEIGIFLESPDKSGMQSYYNEKTDLLKILENTSLVEKINLKDNDINNFFVSEGFIDFLNCISEYAYHPLMPINVAYKLRELNVGYKLNLYGAKQSVSEFENEDVIEIITSRGPKQENLFPCIYLEEKRYPLSIIHKYIKKDLYTDASTYESWENFRNKVKETIYEIKNG